MDVDVTNTTSRPAGMLTIGEFSRFTRLSVRMLRYYDTHGVLVPAQVDRCTGYRYYAAAQLVNGALVRELRDVGIAVAAIAAVLPHAHDPATLRRALETQRGELETEAAAVQQRMVDLDHMLTRLETPMSTDITTQTVPAHTIVALRDVIPAYSDEGQLWERLMPLAAKQGAQVQFITCGANFHDEGYKESDVDVEVWLPVAAPFDAQAPLTCQEVPERQIVVATLRGGYDGIGQTCEELGTYVAEQNLRPTGPMFNRYVVGPAQTQNPDEYVTEVCLPL